MSTFLLSKVVESESESEAMSPPSLFSDRFFEESELEPEATLKFLRGEGALEALKITKTPPYI